MSEKFLSDDELFGDSQDFELVSDDDLFADGADFEVLSSEPQQTQQLPTPAGGFEQQQGPGTKDFLKSAVASTVDTALPGVATFGKSVYDSLKSRVMGENKPPEAFREQNRQQIEQVKSLSPEGQMAGNIAGLVGGGGGIMAATKGLGRAGNILAGTAYDAAAGAGESYQQGGSASDIGEAAGTRAVLGNIPTAAIEGASLGTRALGRGALQTFNQAARVLAKSGVEDPAHRAAVDFMAGPQGRETRDALYRQGLNKNFMDVAKDYKSFKEQGFVKNMDDYYNWTGGRIRELGQARQQLVNQIPDNVTAEFNPRLSEDFRMFLDERLPREINRTSLERALNRYETAATSNPSVKGQVEALQAFKSEVDAIAPNLFAGQATPFGKQLRQFMTEGVRGQQQQLLNQVDPQLANTFDVYNAQMADMYNTRNLLAAKTRDKSGGLTAKGRFDPSVTNPSIEKTRRSMTRSSESALRDRLSGQLRSDFDEVATLQNKDLQRVMSQNPNAPSNLREAARGLEAQKTIQGGNTTLAEQIAATRPLSRPATLLRRVAQSGGETSARALDRTDSLGTAISNRFRAPDNVGLGSRLGGFAEGSARSLSAQGGDYTPQGQIDSPEFRQEVPNRALQSAIKAMSNQPVTNEFLTSLSKQYNVPTWELERLFKKYGQGVQ